MILSWLLFLLATTGAILFLDRRDSAGIAVRSILRTVAARNMGLVGAQALRDVEEQPER